jgi:hypothetical protein
MHKEAMTNRTRPTRIMTTLFRERLGMDKTTQHNSEQSTTILVFDYALYYCPEKKSTKWALMSNFQRSSSHHGMHLFYRSYFDKKSAFDKASAGGPAIFIEKTK